MDWYEMRSRRAGAAITTACVCLAAGCRPSDAPLAGTVADSAGVRMVTHAAAALPELALSLEPSLVVGATDRPDDQLYQVRGGFLTPDGSVVVANSGSQELRYYAADGHLIRAVGGDGDGPGEFRGISWIHPWPDGSVTAFDARARRLTRVSADGEVADLKQVELARSEGLDVTMPSTVMDVLPGGGVLALLRVGIRLEHAEGVRHVRGDVTVLGPDLEEVANLGSVLLLDYYELPKAERFPVAAVPGTSVAKSAGNANTFAFTDGAHHRIQIFDAGSPAVYVTEDRRRRVAPPPEEPGPVPAADSLPAYTNLRVDADGRVWARRGTEKGAADADWVVFSGSSGQCLGRMALPASAEVLDARGSRLLLLLRDDLDVERVEVRAWSPPDR